MDISEERWAKMIEEVKRLSEFRNEEERVEETEIFKIVYYYDDNGRKWYRWHNLKKEEWECSEKSFEDKGGCLLNFILERVNFINQ